MPSPLPFPAGACEDAGLWTLSGNAAISGVHGVHGGASALVMETNSPGSGSGATALSNLDVIDGREYELQFWLKRHFGSAFSLSLLIDRGSGSFDSVHTYTSSEPLGVWQLKSELFTAIGSTARIRFQTQAPSGFASTRWLVDDAQVLGDQDVITSTLRAALEADLAAIDGTGAFLTDLATISREPIAPEKLVLPAVEIVPGPGGDEDPEDGSMNVVAIATQSWTLKLSTRSATPHEAIEKLLDDVRLAVGRTTSNLRSVTGSGATVIHAAVTSWDDEVRTSPDLHLMRAEQECVVSVKYQYDRNVV